MSTLYVRDGETFREATQAEIDADASEQTKQPQYPDPYEGITPIRECSIAQLIDCGPECACYSDTEIIAEIERRIKESFFKGAHGVTGKTVFSESAGSEGELQ